MNTAPTSPVSLSYAAALRGVKPRRPGENFTYADVACTDSDLLTCLAASNPEGRFFGLVADDAARTKAEEQARQRDVKNVTFVAGSPRNLAAQLDANPNLVPILDYLVCDESVTALAPLERNAVFAIAEKNLKPGGLFNYKYRAYDRDDDALRFVIREFAPEMDGSQAVEFLGELKKLGSDFLAKHSDVAAKLDACIAQKTPDDFFSIYESGESRSATFNTLVALNPRGMIYAGDSDLPSNYLELSVPPQAQDVILKCRTNPLYESVKDYALNRPVRSDIWCRGPVPQATEISDLFGGFTYGITRSREDVPASVTVQGKTIDLSSQLYVKLVDLLTLMPASVGDFLAHPDGKGYAPLEVVGAMQILVALGIAQPMRGLHEVTNISSASQPRLVGGFNQHLDKTAVTGRLWLASPVAGGAMLISARDALVMQALGRGGLVNSVSALMPELQRLAKNPAQAAAVMDVAEPTPEVARSMIEDVVTKSLVQWYAYGLLEAA
ncbi:MAG TPA: methyltransferase regulatory domain-containing protein [Alphaproteobacteria bacterium]|nr:methyltransferase regulatory domain-containing protein [Alphaproteobacteria bacterium]